MQIRITIRKRVFLLLIVAIHLCISTIAATARQTKIVSGTVVDEQNQPIVGATVIVKNTTTGTVTDLQGKFELTVPNTAQILVFSFTGMKTVEVAIENQTVFNIVLHEDVRGLSEVLVTALGIKREKKHLATPPAT